MVNTSSPIIPQTNLQKQYFENQTELVSCIQETDFKFWIHIGPKESVYFRKGISLVN